MMKKIISLIFILGVFFNLNTPHVLAVVPDGDDVQNTNTTIQTTWQVIAEDVLVPIVLGIADQVLNKLTQDIVVWANGGFEGDPGFINNWDEFLKNTQHQVISGTFQSALFAASAAQQGIAANDQEEYQQCIASVEALYGAGPNCSDTNAQIATAQQCYVEIGCDSEIAAYTAAQSALIECESLNDDFSECEPESAAIDFANIELLSCQENQSFEEEVCDNAIVAAELAHEQCLSQNIEYANAVDACGNGGSFGQTATEIAGQIAQQNYTAFQSDEVINTRSIALAVGQRGAQELTGNDSLDVLIAGGGGNLQNIESLYGENSGVSFLAAFDETNNLLGRTKLVNTGLNNKINNSVQSVVQEQQTPSLIQSKKRCTEYKKDAAGNRTKECAREITGTPGDVVADKLKNALNIENEKALNLSGGLISSLIGAIGNLTDGLTSVGLNRLTGTVENALFNNSNNDTAFAALGPDAGNYQSQYDVFGISANGGLVTDSDNESIDSEGNIFNENSSNTFVGGPEDEDGTWNGGPRIVINLNESLESNLQLAIEEKGYFDQIDDSLRKYKNTAIELDWCIPGPDNNWEERFRDSFSQQDDDFGYSTTKKMVEDPWVNIPGSLEMRDAFDSLVDAVGTESVRVRQRREDVTRLVRTLEGIKSDVKFQFTANITEPSFANLVLFSEDWQELSQAQKIQALTIAEIGFLKQDGTQSNPYIIVKEEDGETIESIVLNEPGRAEVSVKAMAWDIWRDRTSATDKQDLRYLFYTQETRLSNQRFISEIRANANQIERGGVEINKLFNDCLVLKAYTLGEDVDSLQDAVASNQLNQLEITGALYLLNPYLAVANVVSNIFGGGGLFGPSGQEFSFIELDNARSDEEIRDFLEDQFIIFQDENPSTESIFQTDVLIKPSAINNSILRFDDSQNETVTVQISAGSETQIPEYEEQSLPQTEAYLQQEYPDFGFKEEIKNVLEMKDIYKYDRFYSGYNRARGLRGSLYCRNPNTFDAIDGTPDSTRSKCIQTDWYITKRVQYEEIFSQFN